MAGLLAPVRKADCFLHYHFTAERGWIARSMGVGGWEEQLGRGGGWRWGGGGGGGRGRSRATDGCLIPLATRCHPAATAQHPHCACCT